jgi:hypothetical protein
MTINFSNPIRVPCNFMKVSNFRKLTQALIDFRQLCRERLEIEILSAADVINASAEDYDG